MYDPLGLSIGTTNLVAARNGSPPVTRRAVLTLYPHCAPKVGVPGEDPNLTEPGMLISGFVERIGDSVALVSGDGSAHDPDLLIIEALDAMVSAVGADAGSSEISIAVPAYWKPPAVQALRDALRTHVGFVRSGLAPCLVSDAVAALTAVNAEVGLPDDGTVGLLDFGGAGTSATLLSLGAAEFEPVSATMRWHDFSGNEIDQALLYRVFDELGYGQIDPSSPDMIAQIGHVREQCRAAKERLSANAHTDLVTELGGRILSIRLTRDDLEDLIQDRLTSLIYALDDMLVRCKKNWTELAAVVTVGGVASLPLIAQRLSMHTRLPVLTASEPALAAATGALMLATRAGEELDMRTRTSIGLLTAAAGTSVIELPAGDVMVIDQDALTDRELAWSQTEFPGDVRGRFTGDSYDDDGPSGWSMRLNVIERPKPRPWRRLRLSQMVVGLCAVVAVTAIGGVAYTLAGVENREAPVVPNIAPLPAPPVSSVVPSPVPPPPSAPAPPSAEPPPSSVAPPPPQSPPPPPAVVTTTAPPPVVTTQATAPHTTTMRPTTTPPTTMTTTTTPPTSTFTTPSTTTTTTVPMTTEWLHIPLLPVPIPVPVPQSQPPTPQYPAQVPQAPGYPQSPYLGPGG